MSLLSLRGLLLHNIRHHIIVQGALVMATHASSCSAQEALFVGLCLLSTIQPEQDML